MSSKENGYRLPLVSLGGIVDKSGKGRESVRKNGTISSTTETLIISDNARRISANIMNTGSEDLLIFLGNDTTSLCLRLKPNGSCQIDSLMPWTGVVYAALTAAGSTTYDGGEISIASN